MPDVDFSRNAGVYDRRHGARLHEESARALTAGLPPAATILDIGAGTGRVSLPLAALGFRVVALDPAVAMIEVLRGKAAGVNARPVRADGRALPFSKASFDAAVLSRILYLIAGWRDVLREAIRVIGPDARLLCEWGNGSADEEWVQIRERARTLFEQAGVHEPFHPGARTETEVESFLAEHKLRPATRLSLGPGPATRLADFLRSIDEGECSYIWNVPGTVRARCLPLLTTWAASRFDLDRPVSLPREICWTIYQR